MIFWQKLQKEGVTKHIVKNRITLFCMIYYSIWPNQGTLCLSVSTPDPQKVIGIIENESFKAWTFMIFVKILGEGGRSTWTTLGQNKFVKKRVGGREINLNLDNVFKYNGFFDVTLIYGPLYIWCDYQQELESQQHEQQVQGQHT